MKSLQTPPFQLERGFLCQSLTALYKNLLNESVRVEYFLSALYNYIVRIFC
ncbi:hypothetical protein JOD01_003184 [Brevibacillus fulvus]|uniref:Uncharacterized protein n=1 Tax=Brevibacillus fulvus TaxID=1125967 RepID=A0A938XW23_9BACL|nr:hypothetical protein [Brevibacillus fulvus]